MHQTRTSLLEQMNDPVAEQHWAVAMAETVCVAGCTCIFCTGRSNADAEADHTRTPRSRPRRHIRRSLPSTSSIMAVLYPPSCLGTPPAFPEPPSYLPGDAHPSAAQEDRRERVEWTPLISSTATTGGTLVSSNRHDPLVEAPSLTGVPTSEVPPGSASSTELNVPPVGLGIDALEETEPPPAYSRFDESRSRLPVASDVLGPYPRISTFYPPAR